MIGWLALLVAVILFGVANFRRKAFMEHASAYEAPFWESIGFIPLALLALLYSPPPADASFFLLSFGSAAFVFFAIVLFYKALSDGFVSVVTATINLNTAASALLAFFVFSEAATPRALAGIALAAAAIVFLSGAHIREPGRWLLFSLASLFFFAIKNLFDKQLSVSYNPMAAFAVVSLITVALYSVLWAFSRHKAPPHVRLKLASNGLLISGAFAALFFAYSKLPLSVAAPVAGMNLVVTALLGIYLLRENSSWLGIAFAAASVWLLAG